jgi:choline kinase
MSKVSRAIILAAGRGHQLDGINKILIRHPVTGKTILDHAISAFTGKKITVVVGFRAVQIMQKYPELDYVINHDWALSNNAMSLGLALDTEPTYVISGDIFIEDDLIRELDECGSNLALTEHRENRTLTAIHCILRKNNTIEEVYQGAVRDMSHPEAIGLFKISDEELLQRWKHLCIRHGNLFVAQTLPCDGMPICSVPIKDHTFKEINTPADYLRFIQECRK